MEDESCFIYDHVGWRRHYRRRRRFLFENVVNNIVFFLFNKKKLESFYFLIFEFESLGSRVDCGYRANDCSHHHHHHHHRHAAASLRHSRAGLVDYFCLDPFEWKRDG